MSAAPPAASGGGPIVVTGASGLVGRALGEALRTEGRPLRLVSRSPERLPSAPGVQAVGWDGRELAGLALAGAAGVVHLAGEPIFGGLPTRTRRERMWTSRVDTTRNLARRLGELGASERPRVLVCATAVGYYGDRGEVELDEEAGPGTGFLAELCQAWEEAAQAAAEHGLRVVRTRFAVVLSGRGGALPLLSRVFRAGLGGRLGSGRQWFPWVHLDDVVALVRRALDDERLAGAVNVVAPGSVRNADFTREVARAVGRPAVLPVPGFAVRLALQELAGEFLGSRRVVPARARALGHTFRWPELPAALAVELK